FFQAEDGIRDRNVTGVQTCALPISRFRGAAGRPREIGVGTRFRPLRPLPRPGGPEQGVRNAASILFPLRGGWPRGDVGARRPGEIGRASCRERVEGWVGGGAVRGGW